MLMTPDKPVQAEPGDRYTPALPLRSYQQDYFKKLAQRPQPWNVFANFCEMGTGKSAMLLAEWGERVYQNDLYDLLIVAPAGSIRNWWGPGGELEKHLAPELRERTVVEHWTSGPTKQHRDRIARFLTSMGRPRVLCVNVEALGVVEVARSLVLEFLGRGDAMWAIDESTRIRSPGAKRTDWIVRAGVFARARRILSGLPTPRSPMDLYSQFEFLDWRILGHRSYFTFRQRYAIMQQIVTGVTFTKQGERKLRKAWVDVGYRNQEELQQRIEPWSYRVLKHDCIDLPPKTFLRREVELTDEQRRVYDELRANATAELDGGGFVSAERRVTQILRLHQVACGHVTTESGEMRALRSNRYEALLETAEESGGKGIVWFAYAPGLVEFSARLEKDFGVGSVARFWGGNRESRDEEERKWKGERGCRFMCATMAAGGVGNNWQAAEWAIYVSNSYDLEHRQQSEDRCHRAGQMAERVAYTDLVAPGTVDERILEVLEKKLSMSQVLMGDGEYKKWLS